MSVSIDDQLFSRFRANLNHWEGGYADRPKSADPGGPTQKGISQKTLDELLRSGRYPNLPHQSKFLTDSHIDTILCREYFEGAQIDKLAKIPGLLSAAPKLVEQIFDAGVLHGPEDAGVWLQEALDRHLGTNLSVRLRNDGAQIYDGIIGSKTRAAVAVAVRQNRLLDVNNEIVEKRIQHMKRQPNFSVNPGWIVRARSFLM
jgi:lysozyme family protein